MKANSTNHFFGSEYSLFPSCVSKSPIPPANSTSLIKLEEPGSKLARTRDSYHERITISMLGSRSPWLLCEYKSITRSCEAGFSLQSINA